VPKVSISLSTDTAREIAKSRDELNKKVKEIVLLYAERSRACKKLKYVFEVIEESEKQAIEKTTLKTIIKMMQRQIPLTQSENKHLELYLKILDKASNIEDVATTLLDYIIALCRDYITDKRAPHTSTTSLSS